MQELEDEIYEKLEELRQREQQNSELDETYRQARKAKEINDALFDAYAKDKRLIRLLTEKEEELHQKQILDRLFFADMRDELRKQQMQIEDSKITCQIQLEQKE